MYSLEFSKPANRFFQKLPREGQLMIVRKLEEMRGNPFHFLRRLKGNKFWRLRVGDYRAVVDVVVSGNKIVVLRIGHRRNVY